MIAVLILLIGVFILFSKEMVKTSMLGFFMTFIMFIVLLVNKYYFLALTYIAIDVFIKFEIFLFLTNKGLFKKKVLFKKQQYAKKIVVSMVLVIFAGLMHALYNNKNVNMSVGQNNSLELLTVACVVSIFLVSGYVIKSDRWKQ